MSDQARDNEHTYEEGILPEDYRFTAELLRRYSDGGEAIVPGGTDIRSMFRAVCSNNLNIILAALDAAGKEP